MAIYDLYEVKASSIDKARELIEEAGISLVERESSYHRGPYFAYGEIGQENFELKINLDPFEDIRNEEEFPNSDLLLYINNTPRSDELKAKLLASSEQFVLLRHEDL